MENGSVQQVRSEREIQYGRADMLAIRAQTNEARLVAMTETAVRLMSSGRAVAARERAAILKTG